jgi:nicotinate-nucleotide adenylyltransferase
MKIALFGTSADPPTIAHANILQGLSDQFDHVAIWAADNPFKPNQTPLVQREAMLRLMIESMGQSPDRLQLYPQLSHLRTWTSVTVAQEIWPMAEFTLVVGADILPQLPGWYRSAELLKQVSILVVPRQGYRIHPADLEKLRAMGPIVSVAHFTPPKVASSDYRLTVASDLLFPSIHAYIQRERLYRHVSHPENQQQVQAWQVLHRDKKPVAPH